jgi:hypothetical protein
LIKLGCDLKKKYSDARMNDADIQNILPEELSYVILTAYSDIFKTHPLIKKYLKLL